MKSVLPFSRSQGEGSAPAAATAFFFLAVLLLVGAVVHVPRGGAQAEYRPDNTMTEQGGPAAHRPSPPLAPRATPTLQC